MKDERKNEEYLAKVFALIRSRDEIAFADTKTHFNKTELRLINEVIAANTAGKRVISTQLAKRLGVTRSAISQIVNRLEARGVITRVSSEHDKKIAYIELSNEILAQYGEDIEKSKRFVGALVEEFGEENFNKLCELTEAFVALAKTHIKKKR